MFVHKCCGQLCRLTLLKLAKMVGFTKPVEPPRFKPFGQVHPKTFCRHPAMTSSGVALVFTNEFNEKIAYPARKRKSLGKRMNILLPEITESAR